MGGNMPVVDVVRDAKPRPIAPIDESVLIPGAVKRAAAHSEAFYSANPPLAAAQPIPFDVSPVVMKQAEPATPAPVVSSATPPTQVEPVAPAQVEPAAPVHSDNDVRAMAGRLKKQASIITDMQAQMSALGDELIATQRQLRAPPTPPQPAEPPKPLLSEQEIRDYGPEFLNVVKRAAREEFLPEIGRLEKENTQLRQQNTQQGVRGVYTYLDTNVPDWRNVNHSAAFKSWLRLRDSLSGSIRQELLNTAFETADALRVAAFFKGFLSEEAASPASRETPQPQLVPARQPAISLETLAAPGRARSAPSNLPAEKPVYTRREIQRFYDDGRKGLWVGREVDKARIEADIFAAQAEGRIRG